MRVNEEVWGDEMKILKIEVNFYAQINFSEIKVTFLREVNYFIKINTNFIRSRAFLRYQWRFLISRPLF